MIEMSIDHRPQSILHRSYTIVEYRSNIESSLNGRQGNNRNGIELSGPLVHVIDLSQSDLRVATDRHIHSSAQLLPVVADRRQFHIEGALSSIPEDDLLLARFGVEGGGGTTDHLGSHPRLTPWGVVHVHRPSFLVVFAVLDHLVLGGRYCLVVVGTSGIDGVDEGLLVFELTAGRLVLLGPRGVLSPIFHVFSRLLGQHIFLLLQVSPELLHQRQILLLEISPAFLNGHALRQILGVLGMQILLLAVMYDAISPIFLLLLHYQPLSHLHLSQFRRHLGWYLHHLPEITWRHNSNTLHFLSRWFFIDCVRYLIGFWPLQGKVTASQLIIFLHDLLYFDDILMFDDQLSMDLVEDGIDAGIGPQFGLLVKIENEGAVFSTFDKGDGAVDVDRT